ncbi:MAG: cytochrome P450 [Rhodococcus sp. (in: high G+C Gram-positive bacteria)]
MRAATSPIADSITIDQLDADPFPIFAQLRKHDPVAWVPVAGAWFVTRRADMESIYRRSDLVTAATPDNPVNSHLGVPNVLTAEGDTHDYLRGPMSHALLPRMVDTYVDDLIGPIVERQLATLPATGRIDLLHDYFEPISVLSLANLIGVGDVPLPTLQHWFHSLAIGSANFELDPAKTRINDEAKSEAAALLSTVLDRLEREPDGCLISELLHRDMPPGQTRDRELILPTILILIVGGSQEPGHAAGNLFHGLFSNPEQLTDLKQDIDTLLPKAINESLRWNPPAGTLEKLAMCDFELRGQQITKGDMVVFLTGSVNRDEEFYDDGESFDIHRPESTHRAFGMGRHMCMGHWFSRRQIQIAVRSLLAAYPNIAPVAGDPGELNGWAFRGPARLPADLGSGSSGERTAVRVIHSRRKPPQTLTARIAEIRMEGDDVRSLHLQAADGGPLPAWTPGAHIDLHLSPNLVRQYSLCSDQKDLSSWRVAVRRNDEGRGGSRHVHTALTVGDELTVSMPRNHFELDAADNYVFVAGGIGITPILPMIRAADDKGVPWKLLYLGRHRRSMPFLHELADLGGDVEIWESETRGRCNLASALAGHGSGTAVYFCGPESILADLRDSIPDGATLHFERFGPAPIEPSENTEFILEVEGHGQRVVRTDETVLHALEELGGFVPSGCTVGVCGSCVTTVVSGDIDHRDSVLTDEERAEGTAMTACVSRCRSERLVLRLED